WGWLWPRIILPSGADEWPLQRQRVVLAHELAHIARWDWLLQLGAGLLCTIYWFHPLAWIAAARLREEAERACDDCVLRLGIEASDYAEQLLDLTQILRQSQRRWSLALAFARPSHLERRFVAMLNPSENRRGLSAASKLCASALALLLLIPLAAI